VAKEATHAGEARITHSDGGGADMSDTGGKGDHQAWSTTREKKRGVPSDTSVQSLSFENISEVVLRRSLFIGVDKLE